MEVAAEHGGHGERLDHRGGQLVEPAAHRLPYAGCDGGGQPVGVPQPGGLLDEERVAAGAPVHLVDEVGAGFAPGGAADQRGHLVAGQPGEGDGGGLRGQRQQQRSEPVVAGLDLGVAVGADQQEPFEPGVLGGELEQPHRGRVGPVQVVEDDHDRPVLGDGHQRRGHGVVQGELRLTAVVRGLLPRRVGAGALAEQRREARPGGLLRAGPVVRPAAQAAQHLHPGPVAGGAVGVPAGRAEHQRPAPPGLVGSSAHQRGLPDARLAGDQDQTAVARGHPVHFGAQQGRGVLPPDDRLAEPRLHDFPTVVDQSDNAGNPRPTTAYGRVPAGPLRTDRHRPLLLHTPTD
ncbi:hypothetical protein B0E53_02056 [Micromonospora sp. MH33]|nr:hypothetical protein B0E53_02056 [Micromonospora sp. MH33]